MDNLSSQI
jgi:hypothetical protein